MEIYRFVPRASIFICYAAVMLFIYLASFVSSRTSDVWIGAIPRWFAEALMLIMTALIAIGGYRSIVTWRDASLGRCRRVDGVPQVVEAPEQRSVVIVISDERFTVSTMSPPGSSVLAAIRRSNGRAAMSFCLDERNEIIRIDVVGDNAR